MISTSFTNRVNPLSPNKLKKDRGSNKGEQFLHKKRNLLKISRFLKCFAEREGFEPPVPLGTVVFKTTVIDHSTISPMFSDLMV